MVRSISFDIEYTINKNNDRDFYLNSLNEDTANTSNFKCVSFIICDVSAMLKEYIISPKKTFHMEIRL